MGVSNSPRELAGKLNAFAKDVGNVKVPLGATALHVKQLMQASAAASGALDIQMPSPSVRSNPAANPCPVPLRTTVQVIGSRTLASSTVA